MGITYVKPEALVVVEDVNHPLYDEREARPLLDADVLNVLAFGIISPVTVVRRGQQLLVVDGRLRVRLARRANEILRERGQEPMKLGVIHRHGSDDAGCVAVAASANNIRHDDTRLEKIRKMGRLSAFGWTHKQIGLAFGLSYKSVSQHLSLSALSPDAQTALAEKNIRIEDARALAKLPAGEQAAALEVLIRERPTRKALRAQGRNAFRTTAPRVRTDTRLRRLAELIAARPEEFPPGSDLLIGWALGSVSDRQLVGRFQCTEEIVRQQTRHHGRSPSRSRLRCPTANGTSPGTASAAPFRAPGPSAPGI